MELRKLDARLLGVFAGFPQVFFEAADTVFAVTALLDFFARQFFYLGGSGVEVAEQILIRTPQALVSLAKSRGV